MMDFAPNLPGKHTAHEDARKHTSPKRHSRFGLWLSLILVSVYAVVATTTAIVFIVKHNKLLNDPALKAQSTKEDIIGKISKLYDVPNEEPTLARVNDQEKLRKEQDFFKNAQNGDYVIVYPNAKLGILYRESSNKIINIGPVAANASDTSATESADETQ